MQVDWEAPQKIVYNLQDTDKNQFFMPTPEAIVKRGTIRIGYNPSRVPFSFYNNAHKLVGFDIEMMNHLSSALGVSLDFIPFTQTKNLYQALDNLQ